MSAPYFNAYLQYSDWGVEKRINLIVTDVSYGWNDPSSTSQTRKRRVYATGLPLSQTGLTIAVDTRSEAEHKELVEFIRLWQLYTIRSSTMPNPLNFVTVPKGWDKYLPTLDYKLLVNSVTDEAKVGQHAPSVSLSTTIIRDMLDSGSVQYSYRENGSKWWWEDGYVGGLVAPLSADVYNAPTADDAFGEPNVDGGGGGFSGGGGGGFGGGGGGAG